MILLDWLHKLDWVTLQQTNQTLEHPPNQPIRVSRCCLVPLRSLVLTRERTRPATLYAFLWNFSTIAFLTLRSHWPRQGKSPGETWPVPSCWWTAWCRGCRWCSWLCQSWPVGRDDAIKHVTCQGFFFVLNISNYTVMKCHNGSVGWVAGLWTGIQATGTKWDLIKLWLKKKREGNTLFSLHNDLKKKKKKKS